LQDGDVLICEGGDFDKVGRGTIWHGEVADCVHQNHVFCLRADRAVVMPEFIALQLSSPYGKQYFLGCAKKTSNLASINSSQVKAFPFQLQTLKEQQTLVAETQRVEESKRALATHCNSMQAMLLNFMDILT
jgi:type I restriction enzyme, S subunit